MSNGRLESLPLSPNGTNAFSGSALLMLSLSMWANLIPHRRPLYVLDAIQRQRVQWKVSLFEIQMLRRLCLGNMFLRRPLGPCLLLGSPTPTYMCPHLHMVYMASLHTLLPYPLTSHPNITPIHLKAHGNGTIGTIRSSNRSIPTTAPRAERVGGSHRSHHKRRNMGSGSANRHYNMETKSVRRRSIMDVRSRNRLLHMAAGLKSRQGFIVGKHQ